MKSGSITLILSLLAVPMMTLAVDIPAGGFAGTWKCNLAKSKFAGPTPQSEVFTINPDSRFSITVISLGGHLKGSSALLVDRDTSFLHKTGLSENVLSSKSKWLLPPALCLYRFFQIHHA